MSLSRRSRALSDALLRALWGHGRRARGGLEGNGSLRGNFSTLVSWGMNNYGECGVPQTSQDTHGEFSSLVSSPTEVLDGLDASTSARFSLSAGSTHSAVATPEGAVYSFGKGMYGELGTGRLDPVLEASRVEHLVDHHHVRLVAAGRTCTWFLNEEGNVLGSGTFAGRSALDFGLGTRDGYGGSSAMLNPVEYEEDLMDDVGGLQIFAGSGKHFHGVAMMDAYGNYMRENAVKSSASSTQHHVQQNSLQHFVPFIDHHGRSMELQQSKYMLSESLRSLAEIDSAQRMWDDMAELSCFSESVALPTIVSGGSGLMGYVVGSTTRGNLLNSNSISAIYSCSHTGRTLGINTEGLPVVVEGLKSSRALPMDASSLPASWAQSCLPPPVVLSAVRENGGAMKGVIGEDWYGVLCQTGRVVVWWHDVDKDRTTSAMKQNLATKKTKVRTTKKGGSVFCTQDGTTVTTLGGNVEIREVSGSLDELFVSDGRSVWNVPLPRQNRVDAVASIGMNVMENRNRIMDVGDGGIEKIDVNSRGTVAAVTDSGHLWLLGDVVSEKDLSHAIGKSDERRGRIWEGLRTTHEGEAVVVPGLHGVKDVSLGEHHALAVVL